MEPLISIIIPVYNSEKTLYACLKSIHDSSYDFRKIQIIVVDNQSTDEINIDGSVYKLAPADVEVDGTKIIEIPTNKGTKVKVYSPYSDGLPF